MRTKEYAVQYKGGSDVWITHNTYNDRATAIRKARMFVESGKTARVFNQVHQFIEKVWTV